MNHKRIHPLTGNEILFVDHTGKENGYLTGHCPFCDRDSLHIIAESENSPIYSIVNKYPVVGDTMRQELIIESNRHDEKFSTMSHQHVQQLLLFVQDRIRVLQDLPNIEYVSYFRNFGLGSGGTQPHPHSQLYALDYIPQTIKQEEQGFLTKLESSGTCPICEIVRQAKHTDRDFLGFDGSEWAEEHLKTNEIRTAKQRVLCENDSFQAIAPFASQFPFEFWILPIQHIMAYRFLPQTQIAKLAEIFHATLIAFERFFTKHPFNIALYDGTLPCSHFRFVIYPRLFAPSGFTLSMGSTINGTLPEKAVAKLKPLLP